MHREPSFTSTFIGDRAGPILRIQRFSLVLFPRENLQDPTILEVYLANPFTVPATGALHTYPPSL